MALITVQFLVLFSIAVSVYMIVVTLERCRSEKRYAFVYCIVTIILYSLGYFIEISSGSVEGAAIAVKIMYAGGCFMSPFFFFFAADYCELQVQKKYYRIPMLVIPVLFYIAILTFEQHHLLYLSFYYDTSRTIHSLAVEPGPLYMVNVFYPVFCVVLSCMVLIRSILKQGQGRRFGLILLLASALAPLAANISYIAASFFFKNALAGINFTAFVMILSNFIFFYNVVRNDMFDLSPKAHAITMDLIRDAFIVLDWSMAYTGSNKKAQDLFPGLAKFQKGSSIMKLENWPKMLSEKALKIGNGEENGKEMEFQLPHKDGKVYSGWISLVSSETGTMLGWVIMIQDITETVSLIHNIQAQRDEIAAMRDNLKEGIFFMDSNLIIQDSYSRAMEDILSCRGLHERRFTDLLAASFNPKNLYILADYFSMFINKKADPGLLEDINPLYEFSYISTETGEQKTLSCRFVPVDQRDGEIFIMGTIQDITSETILKKQLAEEEERRQEEMRSFFEVMQADQKVLWDFIEDTEYEFNRIQEALENKKIDVNQKLINIYQAVHAIKSNAFVIDLTGYGMKLHAFETKIKTMREKENDADSIQQIEEELNAYIEGKDKIIEIIRRLSSFSASDTARKDDEIFVAAMVQACNMVASDENKKIAMITENIDREALKHCHRRLMKEALTQLIRNSVHHGIESPEERLALGKDETGKITLEIYLKENAVHMILSDDGRGLDYERIAETAKAGGLFNNAADEAMDIQYLSSLIFAPGFSTSETEDIHAGRGMGLNLVKDRLAEVHGEILVRSNKGQGTTFEILIPAEI